MDRGVGKAKRSVGTWVLSGTDGSKVDGLGATRFSIQSTAFHYV